MAKCRKVIGKKESWNSVRKVGGREEGKLSSNPPPSLFQQWGRPLNGGEYVYGDPAAVKGGRSHRGTKGCDIWGRHLSSA